MNDLSGAFTVSDSKTIAMLYELLDTEGLYLGASSALNVVAAVELAERLGPGEFILKLPANLGLMTSCIRFNNRHNIVRRCLSLSESAVLEKVADQQRIGRLNSRPSQKIYCLRLIESYIRRYIFYSLMLRFFKGVTIKGH